MQKLVAALAASVLTNVANAAPANKGSAPFLTPIGNQTWVIGNDVWNMTQGPQFGVKLYYKGRDCVGDAWGHYVSYSMFSDAGVYCTNTMDVR
jgi:rhamnogalacturonan endolyase